MNYGHDTDEATARDGDGVTFAMQRFWESRSWVLGYLVLWDPRWRGLRGDAVAATRRGVFVAARRETPDLHRAGVRCGDPRRGVVHPVRRGNGDPRCGKDRGTTRVAYVRDHKHRGQSVALDQGWNGFGLILERLFWLRSVKPQVRGMIRACGCVWSHQSLDRRAALTHGDMMSGTRGTCSCAGVPPGDSSASCEGEAGVS